MIPKPLILHLDHFVWVLMKVCGFLTVYFSYTTEAFKPLLNATILAINRPRSKCKSRFQAQHRSLVSKRLAFWATNSQTRSCDFNCDNMQISVIRKISFSKGVTEWNIWDCVVKSTVLYRKKCLILYKTDQMKDILWWVAVRACETNYLEWYCAFQPVIFCLIIPFTLTFSHTVETCCADKLTVIKKVLITLQNDKVIKNCIFAFEIRSMWRRWVIAWFA